MRRNLFLCCEAKNRSHFTEKIREAFENSVTLVNNPAMADMVYVVGNVTPEIRQEMDSYVKQGIKTVHVNENLINEEVQDSITKKVLPDLEMGR